MAERDVELTYEKTDVNKLLEAGSNSKIVLLFGSKSIAFQIRNILLGVRLDFVNGPFDAESNRNVGRKCTISWMELNYESSRLLFES